MMCSLISQPSSTYRHFSSAQRIVIDSTFFLKVIKFLDAKEKSSVSRCQRIWNCLTGVRYPLFRNLFFQLDPHLLLSANPSAAISFWISHKGNKISWKNKTATLAQTSRGAFVYIHNLFESIEIICINTWRRIIISYNQLPRYKKISEWRVVNICIDSIANLEVITSQGFLVRVDLLSEKMKYTKLFPSSYASAWFIKAVSTKESFLLISLSHKEDDHKDQHFLLNRDDDFEVVNKLQGGTCVLQFDLLLHSFGSSIAAFHFKKTSTTDPEKISMLWIHKAVESAPIQCFEYNKSWLLYAQYLKKTRTLGITVIDIKRSNSVMKWYFSLNECSTLHYGLENNIVICVADHSCFWHHLPAKDSSEKMEICTPSLLEYVSNCDTMCRVDHCYFYFGATATKEGTQKLLTL